MEKLRRLYKNIGFHLLMNIVVVIFITGASYYHTPLEGGKDTLVYLFHLILLQITVAGFLYIFSLYKWVFWIAFPTLFIFYCTFSFWAYTQDMSVTPQLIQAVFETKPDIAADLIIFPYFLFLLGGLLVVLLLIKFYNKLESRKGIFLFLPMALACIGLYFVLENKRPNTLDSRLPYNVISGIKTYYEKPTLKLNTDLPEISKSEDSLKVVFILGETVREDHIGLNGYERNTTPLLAKQNVISYSKLHTDHTYTGASVPQLLTDQNLKDDRTTYTSLYSVVNQSKIPTTWIGNQTLEISYGPIVETNQEVILVDKYKSEYSFSKEMDEIMLPSMDSVLNSGPNQLITLHMIGSHWYYENRYTEKFRKYKPVIDSKYIPSVTQEEMINSYDNTILYLDDFMNSIIERLKEETVPTALIYVSDHGEYLGEDGQYLHAAGGDVLKNPAYILWFSDKYKEEHDEVVDRINDLKNNALTTDIIFHTILDILRIDKPDLN